MRIAQTPTLFLRLRIAACLWVILALAPFPASRAQEDGSEERDAAALEEIRTRIRDVEESIRSARDESESIMKELELAEAEANATAARLNELETAARHKSERLDELRVERETFQRSLAEQRRHLAAQVRTAYSTGRHDFIKLLLNQEDPALVGRLMAYHGYFNRARSRKIEEVEAAVRRVEDVRRSIQEESRELDRLREREQEKFEELDARRASRNEVVARLQRYITSRDRELELLQRNEKELADLVERLGREEAAARDLSELPPFASLKGKLPWPVEGDIAVRFGAPRKGGRLRSHGLTIRAASGTEVRAVGAGKVIFADWFRNMGLLVILDHGGGYMSLYGHNEALLRKPGDTVDAGEVIARVGDTGGQQQAGLYFEIRQAGAPVDPVQWCRG